MCFIIQEQLYENWRMVVYVGNVVGYIGAGVFLFLPHPQESKFYKVRGVSQ